MRNYKQVQRTDLQVESVICDRCDTEMSTEDYEYGGLPCFHLSYIGGYNSEYPGDMDAVECDLCEQCLKELVDEFARKDRAVILNRAGV